MPEFPTGIGDPNVSIAKFPIAKTNFTSISAEHEYVSKPNPNGWKVIGDQISNFNLLFVEYFPFELWQTTYSKPIAGSMARRASDDHGIDVFFNRVAGIAHQ